MDSMERPYDQILISARECFQEADDLTPEVLEQFDNMRNIQTIEKNLQAMTRTKKEKNGCIETLKKACQSVMYSVYIYLKCCAAALAKALGLVKDESHLPEIMQIKLNDIRRYLEKLKEKNDGLAALANKITTMVMESSKRGFKISQDEMNELEKTMMKFDVGLEVAENWQKEAEKEWELLNSEITSHLLREGVIAIAKVAAGTVAAAAASTASVALGGTAAIATAAGVPAPGYKVIVSSISALTFGLQTMYQITSVDGEYKELRAKCETLRGNLKYVTTEQKESKITAAAMNKIKSERVTVDDEETGEHIPGSLC